MEWKTSDETNVYELKTTLQVYGMVSHLTFGTAAKHIVYNRTNHMAGGGGGGGGRGVKDDGD